MAICIYCKREANRDKESILVETRDPATRNLIKPQEKVCSVYCMTGLGKMIDPTDREKAALAYAKEQAAGWLIDNQLMACPLAGFDFDTVGNLISVVVASFVHHQDPQSHSANDILMDLRPYERLAMNSAKRFAAQWLQTEELMNTPLNNFTPIQVDTFVECMVNGWIYYLDKEVPFD